MEYNITKLNLYLRYMIGAMLIVYATGSNVAKEVIIPEIILMHFFVMYIVKHTERRRKRYR